MNKEKLLDIIKQSQDNYLLSKTKKYLKNNSQFFTPVDTIQKMLRTINFDEFRNNNSISVLEPSAGHGIIVVTTVLHILDNFPYITNIHFDIYEKDKNLFYILQENMQVLMDYCKNKINFTYNLINDNFITYNKDVWEADNIKQYYSIILSNPPFLKLNKDSEEAAIMSNIVNGQPNIYTLFMCMCAKLLSPNGYYVLISPRNYLSGQYSKNVRRYLFDRLSLVHIHSFDKRNLFNLVNQEVIISTFKNQRDLHNVHISHNGKYSFDLDFGKLIFDVANLSIIIPRKESDVKLFDQFSAFENSLGDLGYKVSVGPVVQFRNTDFIKKDICCDDYAPLLIAKDIQSNNVMNYFYRENTRNTHNKSISYNSKQLIRNSNYLLVRKIAAKDDAELIVTTVLDKNYFNTELLGLDNNLIYFHKVDTTKELTLLECYGLYCFINSNDFSEYYSLINGTHTINISDFNEIKFPNYETILKLGEKLIKSNDFSKLNCSKILRLFMYWNLQYEDVI